MGHADAKTTEIYRHYAPDPTHGAAFVDRAIGDGSYSYISIFAMIAKSHK